ncbi:MAG: GNAT family N-acetyltransferase [Planctomycetota bacterium]
MTGDLSGLFVTEVDGRVGGFTGYSRIMDAPTSAWLSWTYVREDMRRQGVGGFMMESLKATLAKTKVERLFITTSDYAEDGVDIYADARRFYERCGAVRELVVEDFYDRGEAKYIYRLPLKNDAAFFEQASLDTGVAFEGVEVLPETTTAFGLYWAETDGPAEDDEALDYLVDEARGEGAHAVFASMPTALSSNACLQLEKSGFRRLGEVSDFYGAGSHDAYWARYF